MLGLHAAKALRETTKAWPLRRPERTLADQLRRWRNGHILRLVGSPPKVANRPGGLSAGGDLASGVLRHEFEERIRHRPLGRD